MGTLCAVRIAGANLVQFGRNFVRPFAMLFGLPRKIENAVAVFHHAAAFNLHADRDQCAARRIQRIQSFAPRPGIERLQALQNGGCLEARERRFRLRPVVVQRKDHLLHVA